MEKNKKMIIVVVSLLLVVGVSLAYFTASVLLGGNGTSITGTTTAPQGSELTVEGTLEFNDLDIYPGHESVSSIRVTATGNNELIPYNIIFKGINTLNTSLNYTVYKTSSSINVSSSCSKKSEIMGGGKIYYEECTISNIEELGEPITEGTINTAETETKVELIGDEFITSTNDGISVYYYVILEYPNLEESQNIDMGGTFTGEVTIEISDIEPDINIIAAYIEQEDGSYEQVSDIPQSGYTLNTEKSTCSNGATPTGVTPNITINNLSKSGTSCYLYFKELSTVGEQILANKTIDSSRSGAITGIFTENTTGTVFSVTDDWGTSYVFAGAPTDNWVRFAGYYWRIIRINGDGSIRMIYAGTSTSTSGTDDQIQEGSYNSKYNDNAYVGYMYGSTGASSYASTHANNTDSTIKGILDSWYKTNIVDKGHSDKVSTEAGFCNDRKTQSGVISGYGTTGYGKNATAYAPLGRLMSNGRYKSSQAPSLKCSQIANDMFTVSGSSKGNHKLTYPIGLITSDEVVLAGGFGGSGNSSYYLYTGQNYWTMSPSYFDSAGDAYVFFVYSSDSFGLNSNRVDSTDGVRPVINLKADVTITGEGTSSNPYTIS